MYDSSHADDFYMHLIYNIANDQYYDLIIVLCYCSFQALIIRISINLGRLFTSTNFTDIW